MPDLLTKPMSGKVGPIVFDLETNGLSFTSEDPRIHCIALHFAKDERTEVFNDEAYTESPKGLPMGSNYSITTALSHLEVADVIVGHTLLGLTYLLYISYTLGLILAVPLLILFCYLAYIIRTYSI